jgi:hypothetical protein
VRGRWSGGSNLCAGKVVRWVEFVCAQGGWVGRICVCPRWSGLGGEGGREWVNLCGQGGQAARRMAVCSWERLCGPASVWTNRLSTARHSISPASAQMLYSQPKGPIPWTLSGTFALMYGGIRSKGPRNRPYPRTLYITYSSVRPAWL